MKHLQTTVPTWGRHTLTSALYSNAMMAKTMAMRMSGPMDAAIYDGGIEPTGENCPTDKSAPTGLFGNEVERKVERFGGMGEGSAGDVVHSGGGDGGEALNGDVSAGFQFDLAADEFHAPLHFLIGHVVEQNDADAAQGEEGFDLGNAIGFEFDSHAGMVAVDVVDGGLQLWQAGFGEEVIVLQADAVVGPATGVDSGFFEFPPAGGGFARVEKFARGLAEGIDVAAGLAGHAAETLEEIKRGAFGGEDGAGGAAEFHDHDAFLQVGTVVEQAGDFDLRIHKLKDLGGNIHARKDARFLRHDPTATNGLLRGEVVRRDIAGANVLSKGHPNQGEGRFIKGIHAGKLDRQRATDNQQTHIHSPLASPAPAD